MTVKDSPPPAFNEIAGVEFVPIPAWNQPQPQSVNTILGALGGGGNQKINYPKDGDDCPVLEGYVPPVNRNGETAVDDRLLALDKVARLHLIDSQPDMSPFARNVDPRDNDNAPDEWSTDPDKKSVAPATKK